MKSNKQPANMSSTRRQLGDEKLARKIENKYETSKPYKIYQILIKPQLPRAIALAPAHAKSALRFDDYSQYQSAFYSLYQ